MGGSPGPGPVHRRPNGVAAGSAGDQGPQAEAKLVFKAEPLKKVQIDFSAPEPYGKVVRVSLNGKFLASGGDDGHLRVFSLPDLDKVHDFATHDKEIDDIDFSPDSSKICSISKDKRAIYEPWTGYWMAHGFSWVWPTDTDLHGYAFHGSWSTAICPWRTAISGFRTQVEPDQGGGDDTGLNRVEFKCGYNRTHREDNFLTWW